MEETSSNALDSAVCQNHSQTLSSPVVSEPPTLVPTEGVGTVTQCNAASQTSDQFSLPVFGVPSPVSSNANPLMSLSERERLLQQQITMLLPALQQHSVDPSVLAPQAPTRAAGHHHHHHHHQHLPHHSHRVRPHGVAQAVQEIPVQHISPPSVAMPVGGVGPSPAEMAINMEEPVGDAPRQDDGNGSAGHHTHNEGHTSGPANSARRVRRELGDQIQGIPGLPTLLKNLSGAMPFLVIMFIKVMYNHRLGLLVFLAMFGTFYYANSSLKKLIAQRDNQSWAEALSGYAWIFGFLATNIVFVYFVFSEQELYKCLYLQSPNIEDIDLWNLMWITVITDFIIKFGTISVKSLVAILPKHMLAFKKKGKYFLFLEIFSQFYRCVVPIPHWAVFVLEDKYGGQWVAFLLFLAYCLFKILHIKRKAVELRKAFSQVWVDVSFGTVPSREEIKVFDNTCPICQDLFTDAVKLSCKHIFCDDCICLWLDREKTCPMCRAHIVDNPVWRDGATSSVIQCY